MSATCKSCGAPIVWGSTYAGKSVPLDPPEKRYIASTWPIINSVQLVETWTPHFATCPNADQHRRTS